MARKVIIDAGHGGVEPGAVYEGRKEKDDTLQLAFDLGSALEQRGIQVEYTRVSDVYDTPYEKAAIANASDADLFVSIHRNAMPVPGTASGIETLVYSDTGVPAMLARNINEELAAVGIEVSAENPIYIDFPVRTDSEVNMNMKQSVKQSVEAATNGMVKVNLVEYATRDHYLDATYWYSAGHEANFDLNDGSGWGPDYGDPSSYLGTMLPQYAGYMTKSLGIF